MKEKLELNEEDKENLVAVFKLLLEMDRKQNPENYKRLQKETSDNPTT